MQSDLDKGISTQMEISKTTTIIRNIKTIATLSSTTSKLDIKLYNFNRLVNITQISIKRDRTHITTR